MDSMSRRRSAILTHLSQHGQASVHELSELTGVSVVTMRQDLAALEQDGFIRRTHGGATLLDSENIAHRLSIRYDKKLRIAEMAAALVDEGETVLLESGSANALLARELAKRQVQVVAANAFVARQVHRGDAANVVILGGIYQPDSESIVGQLAKLGIESTFFSKAFLGMDGFTEETGFTNRDMMRAEIATLIIKRCPKSYILADSSKFGNTGLARICGLDDLAGVITNTDLPEPYRRAIDSSKAELYLA